MICLLKNLLGLTDDDFTKMREVEEEIIENSKKYFNEKEFLFEKFLNGRSLRDAILELENNNIEESRKVKADLRLNNNLEAEEVLKDKIKRLPENKVPIMDS